VEAARKDDLLIEEVGPESLGEVEPLWRTLHEHHLAVDRDRGNITQPRTATQAWSFRRPAIERWLSEPGGFALIARHAGRPVGFAAARVEDATGTWDVGEKIGVLEILVVANRDRKRGIGERLVEEVAGRFRAAGVRFLAVDVLPANRSAIAFYRRLGAVESSRTYWMALERDSAATN
jgi:ribosomal protein S18 acetylase RimI-like enzyme